MRALEEEFAKCRAVPAMCTIPVITGCRDIPFFTPISLGEDDDDHRTLFLTMLCAFHALLPLPRRRYHTRTHTLLYGKRPSNGYHTVLVPQQTPDSGLRYRSTAFRPFHQNSPPKQRQISQGLHTHAYRTPTHPPFTCMHAFTSPHFNHHYHLLLPTLVANTPLLSAA